MRDRALSKRTLASVAYSDPTEMPRSIGFSRIAKSEPEVDVRKLDRDIRTVNKRERRRRIIVESHERLLASKV